MLQMYTKIILLMLCTTTSLLFSMEKVAHTPVRYFGSDSETSDLDIFSDSDDDYNPLIGTPERIKTALKSKSGRSPQITLDPTQEPEENQADFNTNYSNTHLTSYQREAHKKLLTYEEILEIYEPIAKQFEEIISTTDPETRDMLKLAIKPYTKMRAALFTSIEKDDVAQFKMNLEEIIGLTHPDLQERLDWSHKELEENATILFYELKRLLDIKKYLATFNNHGLVAQNRKKVLALSIPITTASSALVNTALHYILFHLESNEITSNKTSIAVFLTVNFLLVIMVVIILIKMPMRYLCFKINTKSTKIYTPQILQMQSLHNKTYKIILNEWNDLRVALSTKTTKSKPLINTILD